MKIFFLLLFFLCTIPLYAKPQNNVLSLAGEWTIKLDRQDAGITEKWHMQKFTDPVQLPGAMQAQGYGDEPTLATRWIGGSGIEKFALPQYQKYKKYITDEDYKHPFWLTPDKHYRGAAWYQKKITIPKTWEGQRILLHLERCHWETTVFLDDMKIGADSSLVAPHVYDLTSAATPGTHTLTIRVNNDMIVNVGPNSHSVSDHTQSNWNGIVGDISLRAVAPIYIDNVKIYPDVKSKTARVCLKVGGLEKKVKGILSLQAIGAQELPVKTLTLAGSETIEIDYPMGDNPKLWDEFAPNLYTMKIRLDVDGAMDEKNIQFGMRDFKANATRFEINGRPLFLRGTLDCCVFPKTGYPPTDPAEWERIYKTLQAHGLNHVRFHSWCPPKAAFTAADRIGIYLHVEGPFWTNQGASLGDGRPIDTFIYSETRRILDEYGNHPCFVMYAYGNEPAGKRQKEFLGEFVTYWRGQDPRRLYTSAAAWPLIVENDFHCTPAPRIQQWGQGLNSIINAQPPQTMYDWREFVAGQSVPVISHEIGQWCVYPNFAEIPKYTGYLKPKNFDIFYDLLKENFMEDQAHDFLMASGKLQALCYKAEIEAALRTPGFAGFQLLDIHDFPGQGTALVGILDPFYESKPYISPAEFNQFCGVTVPLARMATRTFKNSDVFRAEIDVSHFGPSPLADAAMSWSIQAEDGVVFDKGKFQKTLAIDNAQKVGIIEYGLAGIDRAQKLTLHVSVDGHAKNAWDFWVYPDAVDVDSDGILVVTKLNKKIIEKLKNGATVLLHLNGKIKKGMGADVAIGFSSIFWNTAWTNGQAPHTLGILCDPQHPVFTNFPTEYHSNWQWWDVVTLSQAMILDDFPAELRPIIQPIDSWFYARRLALLFEAKVGKGKIVVSSIDFKNDLDSRLVSRHLYAGLLNYMRSENFHPSVEIELKVIADLF